MILQKYIASSGVCSRRQAEKLIRESVFWDGSADRTPVLVNGRKPEIGMTVSEEDEVLVYGKMINLAKEKIYIILNKPLGVTCTNRDFKEERNVFSLLTTENNINKEPFDFSGLNLHIVGRLDKNSRGLLIITNDGDFTQRITHPSFEHRKEYEVEIRNFEIDSDVVLINEIIKKIRQGIDIGDGDGVVKVSDIAFLGKAKFRIELREGKKRQLRRMFGALDEEVVDIKRVAIGNLRLGPLPEGKWSILDQDSIDLI